MRWRVFLALASLAATSSACGRVQTCTGSSLYDVATIEGPGSIAYHASVDFDQADLVHGSGSYHGTLTNHDPEVDATAVLHRFIEPPSPDDLSGGEVLGERFLPAARQHTFVVPLEDTDDGIPISDESLGAIDEWHAIEVLDASRVEVKLDAFIGYCRDGEQTPEVDVILVRAW